MSILTSRPLQTLWTDAQHHPQWATNRLWEYILNRLVFTEPEWVVTAQRPLTHELGDMKRFDFVVEEIGEQAPTATMFLFVVTKATPVGSLDFVDVEDRALTAACAYHAGAGIQRFWLMTCVGSKARLWIFDGRLENLVPFVPRGDGLAGIDEYLEISTHGLTLIEGLNYCKEHMIPPEALETTIPPQDQHM